MASLALVVSLIVLTTLFIGPITYIFSLLNFPSIIIYLLSLFCMFIGIWFCLLGVPVWYFGLIPIYFGYISILRSNKNQTKA